MIHIILILAFFIAIPSSLIAMDNNNWSNSLSEMFFFADYLPFTNKDIKKVIKSYIIDVTRHERTLLENLKKKNFNGAISITEFANLNKENKKIILQLPEIFVPVYFSNNQTKLYYHSETYIPFITLPKKYYDLFLKLPKGSRQKIKNYFNCSFVLIKNPIATNSNFNKLINSMKSAYNYFKGNVNYIVTEFGYTAYPLIPEEPFNHLDITNYIKKQATENNFDLAALLSQ